MQGLEYAIKQAPHYAQGQLKPLVELDQFLGSLPDGLIGRFHFPDWSCLGRSAQVLCPIKYILQYTNRTVVFTFP